MNCTETKYQRTGRFSHDYMCWMKFKNKNVLVAKHLQKWKLRLFREFLILINVYNSILIESSDQMSTSCQMKGPSPLLSLVVLVFPPHIPN